MNLNTIIFFFALVGKANNKLPQSYMWTYIQLMVMTSLDYLESQIQWKDF
jgi:hypothetical protein